MSSIFGWDYPPGVSSVPGDEDDPPESCPECGGANANEDGEPLYADDPAFCCEECAVAWGAAQEINARIEAEAEADRWLAEDAVAARAELDELAGVPEETARAADAWVLEQITQTPPIKPDADGWLREPQQVDALLGQVLGPRPPQLWCGCGRAFLNCDGSREGCPTFIVSGGTASYRVAGTAEAIRTARQIASMTPPAVRSVEHDLMQHGRAYYVCGLIRVSIEPE